MTMQALSTLSQETLKLFVVGELSSNPNDWGAFGRRAIVIARHADEAVALAGEIGNTATEIHLTGQPRLLLHEDVNAGF